VRTCRSVDLKSKSEEKETHYLQNTESPFDRQRHITVIDQPVSNCGDLPLRYAEFHAIKLPGRSAVGQADNGPLIWSLIPAGCNSIMLAQVLSFGRYPHRCRKPLSKFPLFIPLGGGIRIDIDI
jgi:hypothetical protein